MSARTRAPSKRTAPDTMHASFNGVGAEHVADIQRARLLAAMTDVACERGAANVTVAHVVARAGVSRRTFYELFTDREDCLLAALDSAIAQVSERVLANYDPAARWHERLRGGLISLLAFLDDSPGAGRLLIVESLGAGPAALQRRERVLAHVIATVDEGRGAGKARSDVAPLTAEGVVGGVLSVLHVRLVEHMPGPLVELTGPLMSMIVLPYLGSTAARREMELPLAVAERPSAPERDPLRQLGMRLTYRTIRVLLAIGAHPGASNRQVGLNAGVEDQGQISKLLARLRRLGLIESGGAGLTTGSPNAWALTDRGREVYGAISAGAPGS